MTIFPVSVDGPDREGRVKWEIGFIMLGYYRHYSQDLRYTLDEELELQPIKNGFQKCQVPEEDKKIILYKRRWFMLFLFSTLSASNGINWLTYAPIATTVIREYQVTPANLFMKK